MLKRTVFVLWLSVLTLVASVTQAETRAGAFQGGVYGGGQFPCTTWNETYHAQGHSWERYGEWVAGYVSAATMERGLARTNNTVMFGFIESYCKAHPNETIATASGQFVATLPASSTRSVHP